MVPDTLQQLEFDALLALLRGYAGSPLGQAKLLALSPSGDAEVMAARLQKAAEAKEYLRATVGAGATSSAMLPVEFSGFTDPADVLAKLAIEGTTLEVREIVELLDLAERALDIRRALLAARNRFPHLAREAERVGDFHSLLRELQGKILPSGELDDHASPELRRIRREVEKQRAVLLSSLREFQRSLSEESLSQDPIITIRS